MSHAVAGTQGLQPSPAGSRAAQQQEAGQKAEGLGLAPARRSDKGCGCLAECRLSLFLNGKQGRGGQQGLHSRHAAVSLLDAPKEQKF